MVCSRLLKFVSGIMAAPFPEGRQGLFRTTEAGSDLSGLARFFIARLGRGDDNHPMSVRLLRREDYRHMPWKNGGGSTMEVARWPEGEASDFLWRVSLATIVSRASFSLFPGYDRIIVPLDGAITIESDGSSTQVPRLVAHPFCGDVTTVGGPVDGPVRDLNLMMRRGRVSASVSILDDVSRFVVSEGEVLFFHVVSGEFSMAETRAAGGETIVADEAGLTIQSHGSAQVVVSRLRLAS